MTKENPDWFEHNGYLRNSFAIRKNLSSETYCGKCPEGKRATLCCLGKGRFRVARKNGQLISHGLLLDSTAAYTLLWKIRSTGEEAVDQKLLSLAQEFLAPHKMPPKAAEHFSILQKSASQNCYFPENEGALIKLMDMITRLQSGLMLSAHPYPSN